MVVALPSHPKPTKLGRIYFENNKDLSVNARNQFNSFHVSCRLECFPDYLAYSYTDALHIILALFQSQPLGLEALVLKKILQLDLKVKNLPPRLQAKAEMFFTSSDQILPFFNERGRKIMERSGIVRDSVLE